MAKLIIAKPDKTVVGAKPKDLVFDSDYNYFKLYKKFSGVITTTSITRPHGLGYIPLVLGWIKSGGFWYMLPYNDGTSKTVIDVDATNIIVKQDVLNGTDQYTLAIYFNKGG